MLNTSAKRERVLEVLAALHAFGAWVMLEGVLLGAWGPELVWWRIIMAVMLTAGFVAIAEVA